jgi:hypothetical protein
MSQPQTPPPSPLAAPPPGPCWTRRALVAAAVVLLAGGWILLDALGMRLPPMSRHWPLFILVGGIASLADWAFVSQRPGAAGLGVLGVTLGVDLEFVTAGGVAWTHVHAWGPGVYLAIGLGCLAAWGAHPRHLARLLVPGVLALGLAVTFWGWGRMPLGLFWGALLVLLGVAMVGLVLRSRSR